MSECCILWPRAPSSVCSLSDMSDDGISSPSTPPPPPTSSTSMNCRIDIDGAASDEEDVGDKNGGACCYYPPNPYRRQQLPPPLPSQPIRSKWLPDRLTDSDSSLLRLRRCLDKAVGAGDTALLQRILTSCESSRDRMLLLHAPDSDGLAPLHHAVRGGQLQVARVLVAEGADAGLTSRDGYSALHLAVWYGHADIVEFLLTL